MDGQTDGMQHLMRPLGLGGPHNRCTAGGEGLLRHEALPGNITDYRLAENEAFLLILCRMGC